MSSVFNFNTFNSQPFQPARTSGIDNANSGNIFDGRGNDFLNPSDIQRDLNSFGGSVGRQPSVFGRNPEPRDIINVTRGQIGGILSSNAPINFDIPLFQGGNLFHPIPDLGINPSPDRIIASTTFFQNSLQTEGQSGTGSLFSSHPTADGILLDTTSYGNAIIGRNSVFNQPIAWQQVNNGSVPVLVPFNPDNPVNSNPPIVGFPNNGFNFGFGGGFSFPGMNFGGNPYNYFRPVPVFPLPVSMPLAPFVDQLALMKHLLSFDNVQYPDNVPTNVPGGILNFLFNFPQLSVSRQNELREALANPTTVDEDILAETGITSTGGKYDQGTVRNPFAVNGFLSDTNPFAIFNSGLVTTSGNGNGKIKGTPVQDVIFGTAGRSNIVDGRGGLDKIITADEADLINVHQGDQVASNGGDDILFFNFDNSANPFSYNTTINGGDGTDTVVVTVDGDPANEDDIPAFRKLGAYTEVSMNGKKLYTTNVERIIIADRDGNIGSVFQVNQ